jgi:hypothetical protein
MPALPSIMAAMMALQVGRLAKGELSPAFRK